jgi:hypothetical protein
MKTEKTKGYEFESKGTETGCCNQEYFEKMFEMMGKCFQGQGDTIDFSAMKETMVKEMMELCCPVKPTKAEENTERQ